MKKLDSDAVEKTAGALGLLFAVVVAAVPGIVVGVNVWHTDWDEIGKVAATAVVLFVTLVVGFVVFMAVALPLDTLLNKKR